MPTVITLSDIKPNGWQVDIDNMLVVYHYKVIDDNGEFVRTGSQIFKQGTPGAEDDWLEIPADQYQALVDLTVDGRVAIANKEIGGLP